MSRANVVAKRYAQALYEVAAQQNIVAEVLDQLKLVVDTLKSDAEIEKFLSFPSIETNVKIELVRKAFADRISATLLNTLEMVIVKGRQNLLSNIYSSYVKIAGESLGQAQATVYTAKLLNEEELKNVEATFGALAGKRIVADQIVEPSLLGGVQVRIGDRLYDGSLSSKLARLEKSLKSQAL
ncbi:F-type H+-transporting ATPase subunit delta [Paenibacillus phyllosphaerae]|uniref:ATP synthase subunit delta n=1 Tax=Paenibacillus phyllosphaerae TaxID=274593 RepID=A0A7W5FN14_9BACL|nr:F0F1 ATP synthase subunit delta [Paenibacillus phyllosphaerae]MBB3110579.1 F-type H+-transporting ATPase subunit delta [Paenibacillus phyllosphaerae]